MGFLDSIFGGKREEPDIEEFLNSLGEEEEVEEEEAERYVKPIQLNSVQDYDKIMAEVNRGNIILLNIRPLATKNAVGLKEVVSRIKESVLEMGGDIARITEFYVLVTPPGIKIVKRRSR
ncbi:MAG: uncharacterized protein PWP76_402 [Candidatus Diapherotrites archaeon]|nr:uncharacterized protein [Candidatus Diapherotrites archaeon]